jgi:hypothetical protein
MCSTGGGTRDAFIDLPAFLLLAPACRVIHKANIQAERERGVRGTFWLCLRQQAQL